MSWVNRPLELITGWVSGVPVNQPSLVRPRPHKDWQREDGGENSMRKVKEETEIHTTYGWTQVTVKMGRVWGAIAISCGLQRCSWLDCSKPIISSNYLAAWAASWSNLNLPHLLREHPAHPHLDPTCLIFRISNLDRLGWVWKGGSCGRMGKMRRYSIQRSRQRTENSGGPHLSTERPTLWPKIYNTNFNPRLDCLQLLPIFPPGQKS